MTEEQKLFDYLKRATGDLQQTRRRLQEIESAAREPIAVVGIGCRYPGGVDSPEALWRLVSEGRDAITPFPTGRGWRLDELYDPDPEHPGTSYVREGGFLHDADRFDAGVFEISPREALAMDPQQRLLLETSWEALERATLNADRLRGSATGVFVGATFTDYGHGLTSVPEGVEGYLITGSTGSVLSGRIAYTLGLEGPAVTVDTACSSSLVAIHLAVQALRNGECVLALAGGAVVMAEPNVFVEFSRQGGLAPDARCKPFAAAADGTSLAEGVGMVVLEKLSDARRNGHPVLAVIRGSAINQDGASNGLTSPNGPAQERVIRQALDNAGLTPADIDAVEAHGTGTTLGDPIEAQALHHTYGTNRPTGRPLYLGSIKSNIGHTQAAAGIASLIKMITAMEYGELPRTLHIDAPTPHSPWDDSLQLLTAARPWPETGRPRRAAVSSFGISGTNAHLIVEQPPADESEGERDGTAGPAPLAHPIPWVLSAHDEGALRARARQLRRLVAATARPDLARIGAALAETRAEFTERAVVLGASREEFHEALGVLGKGGEAVNVVRGTAAASRPLTVFVFPGQGSQWPGMARELLHTQPVFAEHLTACHHALAPHTDWSLLDLINTTDTAPDLDRTDVVQPALFAVMVSLARLWQHHGIHPDAVIGHSQGEIAAAHIAGALTLHDAAKIAAVRSRLLATDAPPGGMASVALPADRVETLLEGFDDLYPAAYNSPTTTVVAGDTTALAAFVAEVREQGHHARIIKVDYASHTPHIDVLRERLISALAGVVPEHPTIPFYSTLTTTQITPTTPLNPTYWYDNLRHPVHFHQTLTHLTTHHPNQPLHTIEISPHPILTPTITDTHPTTTTTHTLHRNHPNHTTYLTNLAHTWTHGTPTTWHPTTNTDANTATPHTPLPTYPFQHHTYWLTPTPPTTPTTPTTQPNPHPILTTKTTLATDHHLYTGTITPHTHPWTTHHTILNTPLLPGTTHLELAHHIGTQHHTPHITELTLHTPTPTHPHQPTHLQAHLTPPNPQNQRTLTIHTTPNPHTTPWTHHATATLTPTPTTTPPPTPPTTWPPPHTTPLNLTHHYPTLHTHGYTYGPTLQGLTQAHQHPNGTLYAHTQQHPTTHTTPHHHTLHPTLLDTTLHLLPLLHSDRARLPFSWSGVTIYQEGVTELRVRISTTGPETVRVEMFDIENRPVALIEALSVRPVTPAQLARLIGADPDPLHRVDWVAPELPVDTDTAQDLNWAVVGADPDGLRSALTTADVVAAHYPDLAALGSAVERGATAPDVVLAGTEGTEAGPHGTVPASRATTGAVLDLLQGWLSAPWARDSRLVVVTRRAVATEPGEDVPALAEAPVWGLLRSALTEHPRQFAVLDTDGTEESAHALAAAVATGEDQVAVRSGAVLVPRLSRVTEPLDQQDQEDQEEQEPDEPDGAREPAETLFGSGTVLITGGTGTLGSLLARHLVTEHHITHLHLAGRTGPHTPAAEALHTELTRLGATVTITACDTADPHALGNLLDTIPTEHPLTAVVHAAGTLDDSLVEGLTPERLDSVFRAKVDAAWHLHELTRGLDLRAFVLFSSAAGVIGAPGQGNYAAANTFLDALAHHRRALGLPATSIAWGRWEEASGLTGQLDATDLARISRGGVAALPSGAGLRMFDRAVARRDPLVVGARLDPAGLSQPEGTPAAGTVPAVLRSLVRAAAPATTETDSTGPVPLARTLGTLPEEERDAFVLRLVRAEAARVLGHAAPDSVPRDRPLKELGFDSLTAVELRNRLGARAGLRLPATLVFDHPTPLAISAFLRSQIAPEETGSAAALLAELDRIEEALVSTVLEAPLRARVSQKLRDLTNRWATPPDGAAPVDGEPRAEGADVEGSIRSASRDELLSFIDTQLGRARR
ncbi:type I polyketide synthase [Streptomyces qinzhouensis]|uniref:SDR family NAD(P)-dependent oxidoreductase n=1 Tax=Streptomyces qinzhouensis TaxID=2599401 RepID=A0A5B8JG64_9ACTN|nr:type I polyketide synthase [Streptomyces qinzhouensis]QDY80456.1 SDR family NAD(P)-dependent oxidoreductase [Streptomyces qinzhouensis]